MCSTLLYLCCPLPSPNTAVLHDVGHVVRENFLLVVSEYYQHPRTRRKSRDLINGTGERSFATSASVAPNCCGRDNSPPAAFAAIPDDHDDDARHE